MLSSQIILTLLSYFTLLPSSNAQANNFNMKSPVTCKMNNSIGSLFLPNTYDLSFTVTPKAINAYQSSLFFLGANSNSFFSSGFFQGTTRLFFYIPTSSTESLTFSTESDLPINAPTSLRFLISNDRVQWYVNDTLQMEPYIGEERIKPSASVPVNVYASAPLGFGLFSASLADISRLSITNLNSFDFPLSRRYIPVPSVDFKGDAIKYVPSITASQCATECNNTPRCTMFLMRTGPDGKQVCELKSQGGDAKSDSNTVSYVLDMLSIFPDRKNQRFECTKS